MKGYCDYIDIYGNVHTHYTMSVDPYLIESIPNIKSKSEKIVVSFGKIRKNINNKLCLSKS